MNWLDIYKPKFLKDFKTNIEEINKAKIWIENYKKNLYSPKKVLLIIGNTGVGKTLLGELILKEYNYQKIELNSSDIRSQKKLGEFLHKSLTYKNVIDMFHEGNLPVGILMDEIDTICKLSDKGGMTEFLDILKYNEKIEINKKKNKKMKLTIDDYIKLYNPIVCTSNDINDKKINELKKYSEVINLKKPSKEEIKSIIVDIYSNVKQEYDENIIEYISEYCQGDIRHLIMILEDLYFSAHGKKITDKLFENTTKFCGRKEQDIQLKDSTRILMTEKLSIQTSQLYFDIDCLLTPLMLYHNSLDYIKNSEETSKTKLSTFKSVLESLCMHDTIQTNIFEVQDWDELYPIAAIYGSSIPNYYLSNLKTKNKDIDIEFTSLLNKISQMFVNKKLLNSAKFSLGKINYDTDEIIYITEIMSHYFENYKLNSGENDCSESPECSDDVKDAKDSSINENSIINYFKKPLKNNNSELITFMNKYAINIDDLENILKIEKLNQKKEKRKKKFTLKIKKEISNYLTTYVV